MTLLTSAKETARMPLVFIGMPVFNGQKYLRQALDSIIRQKYSDWKLLISDNCSQDKTEKICKEYVKKDVRIQYYRQLQHIEANENFIFLLGMADCDYFMWAAHDGLWHEDFVDELLKGFTER